MADAGVATGIDHVELFVTDQADAAAWYERVLGFTPDPAFAEWHETGTGPLVLAADDGARLALFERATATRGAEVSPHRVAFGTDADRFCAFLDRLDTLELTDRDGEAVTAADAVDHQLSYSVYFTDPDGNWLELTTNDHAAVAERLA
jgi:catechol 2,3-dioxygenase-like lactoylglutathione lyase family enzyme